MQCHPSSNFCVIRLLLRWMKYPKRVLSCKHVLCDLFSNDVYSLRAVNSRLKQPPEGGFLGSRTGEVPDAGGAHIDRAAPCLVRG